MKSDLLWMYLRNRHSHNGVTLVQGARIKGLEAFTNSVGSTVEFKEGAYTPFTRSSKHRAGSSSWHIVSSSSQLDRVNGVLVGSEPFKCRLQRRAPQQSHDRNPEKVGEFLALRTVAYKVIQHFMQNWYSVKVIGEKIFVGPFHFQCSCTVIVCCCVLVSGVSLIAATLQPRVDDDDVGRVGGHCVVLLSDSYCSAQLK